MKLSIVIPAFNEEKTIKEVILEVEKIVLPGKVAKEVVVVDDGSSDRTSSIVKELVKKFSNLKLISHKTNAGKGAAVKTALEKTTGDIILIQDADLEYNPRYIPKLLNTMFERNAEVVYGTRLKDYPLRLTGSKRTPLITHYLGNKFLSLVTSIFYGVNVSDMETGYKLFRKNVIKGIEFRSKRFDFEPEFTSKVLKKGVRIYEIPILTRPRGYNEGKKITWKDGFVALKTLIKYRFSD